MPLDPSTLEQLQTTVRRFVRERLVPLEAQVGREDRIPAEVVQEMRELGLFGLTVPEAYGGLGLNTEEECKVVMELGWTSPAFRSVIGTNNGIGSQGLVMDGTAAQKDHWLPRMASGEVIGSFALTEPDAGSDAGSVVPAPIARTTASSSMGASATSPMRPTPSSSPYLPARIRTPQAPGVFPPFSFQRTARGCP